MGKKKRAVAPIVPQARPPRPSKLRGWEWWRSLGAPRYVCAPMVDQSERAFRALSARHNVGLAYTPMLLASVLARDEMYRRESVLNDHARGDSSDGPAVIAQLGGSDVDAVVASAKWLEAADLPICAIDLNLGCPQSCAKRGGYGSFLKLDAAVALVRALDDALVRLPVTCKIRALNVRGEREEADAPQADAARTVAFARRLAEAGASLIAVHGRTRAQKGRGAADASVVAAVASALADRGGRDGRGVPVIANGNVRCRADADALLESTGAAAAMSAEALLACPRMFAEDCDPSWPRHPDSCAVALEYVEIAGSEQLAPPPPVAWARAHLVAILRRALPLHPGPAAALDGAVTLAELGEAVRALDREMSRDAAVRPCEPPRRRSLAPRPQPSEPAAAPPEAAAAAAVEGATAEGAAAEEEAARIAVEASQRRARGRQERHRLKVARTVASREARQQEGGGGDGRRQRQPEKRNRGEEEGRGSRKKKRLAPCPPLDGE